MHEINLVSLAIKIGITLLTNLVLLKIVDFIFKLIFKKKKNYRIHIKFLKQVIKGVIVLVSALYILSCIPVLEKYIVSVLASSSLLIVVLGFAAQEALGNIINGLFISIFKPFEIGNRIKLINSGLAGYIEDISLRHTIIKTFNNSRIIVPNTTMNKEMIENSSFIEQKAAVFIDVCVSYKSDVRKAMEIVADIIDSHSGTMDTRTQEDIANGKTKTNVLVRELGESGIFLRACVWTATVDESFGICSDIRLAIVESFESNDIEIAYPRMKVI